jgi:hypothetical protein
MIITDEDHILELENYQDLSPGIGKVCLRPQAMCQDGMTIIDACCPLFCVYGSDVMLPQIP